MRAFTAARLVRWRRTALYRPPRRGLRSYWLACHWYALLELPWIGCCRKSTVPSGQVIVVRIVIPGVVPYEPICGQKISLNIATLARVSAIGRGGMPIKRKVALILVKRCLRRWGCYKSRSTL